MIPQQLGDKQPKVEINISAMGHGSIVIDGHDLSNYVSGFSIEGQAGEATEVTIRLKPTNLALTGEGALDFIASHLFPGTWDAAAAAEYARETLEFWDKSPVLHDDPHLGTAKGHAEDVLAALGERRS